MRCQLFIYFQIRSYSIPFLWNVLLQIPVKSSSIQTGPKQPPGRHIQEDKRKATFKKAISKRKATFKKTTKEKKDITTTFKKTTNKREDKLLYLRLISCHISAFHDVATFLRCEFYGDATFLAYES